MVLHKSFEDHVKRFSESGVFTFGPRCPKFRTGVVLVYFIPAIACSVALDAGMEVVRLNTSFGDLAMMLSTTIGFLSCLLRRGVLLGRVFGFNYKNITKV